jgi:hypothetical protein
MVYCSDQVKNQAMALALQEVSHEKFQEDWESLAPESKSGRPPKLDD